jgi:hypothetical protein
VRGGASSQRVAALPARQRLVAESDPEQGGDRARQSVGDRLGRLLLAGIVDGAKLAEQLDQGELLAGERLARPPSS